MKRRNKILIGLIFFIGISIYVITQHVLPYAILHPQRVNSENHLDSNNIPYEVVNLKSFDGINLTGYRVTSLADSTRASIILVHGIGGCKEHFTSLAISLAELGFESWIFDNRAHGKSEGKFSTYGYLEKKDISIIIDEIKKVRQDAKVGIWGNSLGGAIALQAMEYDKRLKFGVIESTFTDLRQIVYDYQARYFFGIGLKWICDLTLDKASELTDFNPDKVKPLESVKYINQPVLIAHGNADKNISFEYGKALFSNLASKEKEFVAVEGGGHYGLFNTGGENYATKLFNFLLKKSE